MELDVHLKRDGDESWGFRLIGGKDYKMPLTVVKVIPDSPAERAGLQNGDAVLRMNDADATQLTHDDAKLVVADVKDTLSLGVKRGLYDPVLDDYEPIFETVDQADFDQSSQPTEVDPSKVQQFLEPKQCELPELRDIETPVANGNAGLDGSVSRSLTASPFVLQTKPYRPFSTEPLPDIPPLEDPIILNPNYEDKFGKLKDLLGGLEERGLIYPETNFKLPISEQYDADGTKSKSREKTESAKITKEIKFAEDSLTKDVTITENREVRSLEKEKQERMTVEEMKFMEKMKKEIDLDKIEMTAMSLVDKSIEKAVNVADEIKKEIDVELETSVLSSEVKEIKSMKESSQVTKEISASSQKETASKSASVKTSKEASELVELIDKTTDEIISYNDSKAEVSVAKEVQKLEALDKTETVVDERRLSTKQEIEETIVAGSVRRKSEAFDKSKEKLQDVKQSVEKVKATGKQVANKSETNIQKQKVKSESVSQSELKASEINRETVSSTQKTESKSGLKTTAKLLAEQRAYTIGLQTIPHIKGSIHSSYHYNLLLKTFFIHLTDVMVALSRFILTEPVLNKEVETNDVKSVSVAEYRLDKEFAGQEAVRDERKDQVAVNQKVERKQKQAETKQETVKTKQDVVEIQKEEKKVATVEQQQEVSAEAAVQEIVRKSEMEYAKATQDIQESYIVDDYETKKLSGAQMAQLTERKSEELMQKMDTVISEFQAKAGIEESAAARERRSRSRSRVEEEVKRENEALEWVSKAEKQKQILQTTETTSAIKSFGTMSESLEKKKVETVHEKRETVLSKPKDKQMYVAIVESHVYTNKDAIFQEHLAEFSETTSVVSAKETNVALQSSETVATEKVAVENTEIKHETAEAVLEESRELSIVNAQSETVHIAEELTKEKAVEIETKTIQEVGWLEVEQEVVEPVVEIQEMKKVEINEELQQVSIKEEEHVMAVSEKTEIIEEKREEYLDIQELKEEEATVEVIEEMKQEIAEVEIVEPAPVVDAEFEVTLPEKINPTYQEESAALKITKEDIIEVEQALKLVEESELSISKHTEINKTDSQFSSIQKSTTESYESKEMVQEASFTAQSVQSIQEGSFTAQSQSDEHKKLTLQLDLAKERKFESQSSVLSEPASTIDTPTPSTVPPTPLTDEYVFKLQIPLPKSRGTTPLPRDPTPEPEDEDPHIVKKKLVPYIETTLESPIIYDPPLPTPPADKVQSPVYTKPGLRGGADRREYYRKNNKRKEEIMEIERTSSLLASAIDETIKSIEEYKEEVGIETKKEVKEVTKTASTSLTSFAQQIVTKQETVESKPIVYNGYAKVETNIFNAEQNGDSRMEEEWNKIDKQVKESTDKLTEIANGKINGIVEIEEKHTENVEAERISNIEIKSDVARIEERVNNTSKDEINNNQFETEVNSISVEEKSEIKIEKEHDSDENVTANEEVIEIVPKQTLADISSAKNEEVKRDPMEGYRPVHFDPEELKEAKRGLQSIHLSVQAPPIQRAQSPNYTTASGELLGTTQGIVDGLEEAVVDEEVAKELGKPGITEEKIAELISGEAEMLREAHVMGLSRVLKSHMHRADDDSSVDFKKIKPIIESLKDSEVLKALNEELIRTREEEKKKEEKKWTTFLQKPKRPVPKAKFGYYGYIQEDEQVQEPYKVKIVKQPKPKVAPDYKPEDFDTGPLPWEQRALTEPPPPPVAAEDPILVPEEVPEFLEAVDPLPESEVPDLEETGITLPPPEPEVSTPPPVEETEVEEKQEPEELDLEAVVAETEKIIVEDMEQNNLAEQLMMGVQSMVDPNASVEQQLAQMRAQVAALAQLPGVIQQTLELVTQQLSKLSHQKTHQATDVSENETQEQNLVEHQENGEVAETQENCVTVDESNEVQENETNEMPTMVEVEVEKEKKPSLTQEEMEKLRKEEEEMLEEQRRIEKQKKDMMEQMRLEQESRQLKQRAPRVGKPRPVFGPPAPQARPLVLPGGRKWRKPQDAYNEDFIKETLTAQAELIQGKAMGINFMKYEKPPVGVDHLQHSETYKLIHNMEQAPAKRVEMRTPAIAEVDYREKCRSVTPSVGATSHVPQQVQP